MERRGTTMMVVGLAMILAGLIIMVTGPDALPIPLAGMGLVFVAVGARYRRRSTG
jgi:hypothetical protein